MMAGTAGGAEGRDRRGGWTDRGPGLVLADGATWYLPAVDDELLTCLPGLVRTAAVFHRLWDHREAGNFHGQLIVVMGTFAIDALVIQYQTEREGLAELIAPTVATAVLGYPGEGMALVQYLEEVWRYALRRCLVRLDGAMVNYSLN